MNSSIALVQVFYYINIEQWIFLIPAKKINSSISVWLPTEKAPCSSRILSEIFHLPHLFQPPSNEKFNN